MCKEKTEEEEKKKKRTKGDRRGGEKKVKERGEEDRQNEVKSSICECLGGFQSLKGGAAILPCREAGRSSPYIIDRRSVNTKDWSIKQCLSSSSRSSSLQSVCTLGEALTAPLGHLMLISIQQKDGVTGRRGLREQWKKKSTYIQRQDETLMQTTFLTDDRLFR